MKVTVSFNFNGIMHNKFLTGQKVNKEPCCLHEAEFVEKLFMVLHYNNVSANLFMKNIL